MIPTFNEISLQIDSKTCRFSIQVGMSFDHIQKVLCQLQKMIGNIEDEAKAKEEAERLEKEVDQLQEEIKVEEPPQEAT